MLPQYTCNTCGGQYVVIQPDGSEYHHACPPTGSNPDGSPIEHVNKRDERITLDVNGRGVGIVSAGAGVTPLNGAPAVPVTVAALAARAAAIAAKSPNAG